MKLRKTISLFLCISFVFFITVHVQADEDISVIHRFLSADDVGEEGSNVTLEVTVKNSGTSSFTNVLLVQNAPLVLSEPQKQALYIKDFPAAHESTLFWVLRSTLSADQVLPVLSGVLSLNLLGVDDFGQNVSFHLNSKGGVE